MAKKFKIAWLPGDGVGVEVMEAAKIVLDKVGLDAEYIHGDIGWEFWCKEGDAFPPRTIELLKNVDAAMFGAITSKPVKAAEAELVPALQGKGLIYRSPIVRMRQLFDLYICLRPCKAYPRQPAQLQGRHRPRRVPREHRGPLLRASSSTPCRTSCATRSPSCRQPFGRSRTCRATSTRSPARSTRGRARSASSAPPSSSRASTGARRSRSSTRPTSCAPPTGCSSRSAKEVAKDFPEIAMDDANIDAMTMWLLKNPFNYDVLVAPNLYGDIISDLCAQMVGGLASAARATSARSCGVRADARLGAEVRRASTR